MAYGFVYLLANHSMRGLYKIGATERSPHQRAEELSASTGVPIPFGVVCYIEVADPQRVESALHRFLSDFRINGSREFFGFHRDSKAWLLGLFEHHPERLVFCPADLSWLCHDGPEVNPWDGRDEEDGPELPSDPPMAIHELHVYG